VTRPSVRSGSNFRVTFAVLATATGAFSLLQSLVAPVLPLLQDVMDTDQATVTWLLTGYLVSASVCTPIIGRLGDMFGKTRVLVLVLAVLAVGSIVAALAPSITALIAARVIQGVGGGVVPLAFGILRDECPPEKLAGSVGLIAALLAAGGGIGLVLAGPIVDALSYHWLFWIPGSVVTITAIVAVMAIPPSPVRAPGRVSWVAAVLLSGWLVLLLLAVSQAPAWGWADPRTVTMLLAALVVGTAWAAVESRSLHPLIDTRLLRQRVVWTTNLVAFLAGVTLYSTFAFLPAFFQTPADEGYGFTATVSVAGLMVLPLSAGMFGIGFVSGRLSNRYGAQRILVLGTVVTALPFPVLAVAHGSQWEVLPAMVFLGVGYGLSLASTASLTVQSVRPHQTGVASGLNANIRMIGGSIGTAALAGVITANLSASGYPAEQGYTSAFILLGAVGAIAAALGLLVPAPETVRARDAGRLTVDVP
jgi:EmrB/QacA subfamily drug resistance transporter